MKCKKRSVIKNPCGAGYVVKQVLDDNQIMLTAQVFKAAGTAHAWIEKQELLEEEYNRRFDA